jgi:hypothetical protein
VSAFLEFSFDLFYYYAFQLAKIVQIRPFSQIISLFIRILLNFTQHLRSMPLFVKNVHRSTTEISTQIAQLKASKLKSGTGKRGMINSSHYL